MRVVDRVRVGVDCVRVVDRVRVGADCVRVVDRVRVGGGPCEGWIVIGTYHGGDHVVINIIMIILHTK